MEAYGRDLHGENEALRMLSQTHLHSSSSNEMHRYGPFRDHSQMLHSFPHTYPPNFHVGTPLNLFDLLHIFQFFILA
jgi:hypothetical protein